jgi:glycosyltransferase involved in cell wall biosynthesis
MKQAGRAGSIVFLVHYFPPLNSAGAKRIEALSKYFVRAGRRVTVLTTAKRAPEPAFSEKLPEGVEVHALDWLGRSSCHATVGGDGSTLSTSGSGGEGPMRRVKNWVMRWLGQLPDPRLPFGLAFAGPTLAPVARRVLEGADVVIGSSPPWPMLLAAALVQRRFGKPVILDYRDHFSECHEMPGSRLAKRVETLIDAALARRASHVVTVSEPMARYYAQWRPAPSVIMNGFDPEIVDQIRRRVTWKPALSGVAHTIRYLGVITPDRVPRNLLGALMVLVRRGSLDPASMRFEFYGECSILQAVLRDEFNPLQAFFHFKPPVPYQRSLELMVTADYLLFSETSYKKTLSAQGILTTKLFEYLASGRPIIADIDPSMLAGQLIQRCGEHHFVAGSVDAFVAQLGSAAFGRPAQSIDHPYVKTLSRASQAEQYLELLDDMCANA